MLRIHFQRAAIAILLVGMMIAPLGICLQPSPNKAHDCCMQMEALPSLHTDCCVVRTQLPAILSAPTLADAVASSTMQGIPVRVETTASGERPPVTIIPPLSPPTGAFILRI